MNTPEERNKIRERIEAEDKIRTAEIKAAAIKTDGYVIEAAAVLKAIHEERLSIDVIKPYWEQHF